MKNYNTPEMIARVEAFDEAGNETDYGTRIVTVAVSQDAGADREGEVRIDIEDFDSEEKISNLVIRIALPDLVAALSVATLNAERDLQ